MNRAGMTWEAIVAIVLVIIVLVIFIAYFVAQSNPGQSAIADFAGGMMK